jgi:Tol biopolymer transport system component
LGAGYAARYAYSWSQAANAIAYAEGYYEKTKRDVYVLPLRPGGAPECVACTRDNETLPSFSPDGHWIAYTNDHSSRHEIWVQRYPGSSAPVRVSSEGGENSLWAPSGNEIFYRWKNEVWAVGFDPATGKPGNARLLFSGNYERGDFWNRDWLISPDGTRFLMLKIVDDPPDYRRIQVIVNWFEELRTSVKGN